MDKIFVKREIDNKCRICLEDGNIPIFNGDFANSFDVSESICLIGGIEIQENDLYPKKLCDQCFFALQTAVEFRKTAKDTDKKLRECTVNNITTSIEVKLLVDDDFDYHDTEIINTDSNEKRNEMDETQILTDQTKNDVLTDKLSDQPLNICTKLPNEESHILCKICNRNVLAKFWKHHSAVHEQRQNLKKKCYKCNYETRNNKALFEHIQSEHFVNLMKHNDHDYVDGVTLKYIHKETNKNYKQLLNDQLGPSVYGKCFTPTSDKHRVQCVICKKSVLKTAKRDHYSIHDPKYKNRFQCPHCKKGYRRFVTLKNHQSLCQIFRENKSTAITTHTKTEQNKMEFIKIRNQHLARKADLKYKKALNRYSQYYESVMINNQPLAQCQMCLKNVKINQFNDHYRWVHLNATKNFYLCELCGKILKSKLSYDHHYASHKKEFNFKCNLCPYRGCNKGLLRSHMRTHKTNYFQCDICAKKCIHKCNLISHIRRHYERPKYECTLCLKKFCSKDKLKDHITNTHLKDTHPCTKCGKEYTSRKYMLYHQRKVHGIKVSYGGVHHRAHCKAIEVQDS